MLLLVCPTRQVAETIHGWHSPVHRKQPLLPALHNSMYWGSAGESTTQLQSRPALEWLTTFQDTVLVDDNVDIGGYQYGWDPPASNPPLCALNAPSPGLLMTLGSERIRATLESFTRRRSAGVGFPASRPILDPPL